MMGFPSYPPCTAIPYQISKMLNVSANIRGVQEPQTSTTPIGAWYPAPTHTPFLTSGRYLETRLKNISFAVLVFGLAHWRKIWFRVMCLKCFQLPTPRHRLPTHHINVHPTTQNTGLKHHRLPVPVWLYWIKTNSYTNFRFDHLAYGCPLWSYDIDFDLG